MALDSLVRNAVAMAKRIAAPLLVPVTHQPMTTLSDGTVVANGAKRSYQAVVEDKVRRFQHQGVEVNSKSKISFLEHVAVAEPDRLVLPDGSTGPIYAVDRPPLDPKTGGGYVTIVWLGTSSAGGGAT